MVFCSYQDKVAEIIAAMRKEDATLMSNDNLGTAKDLTDDELAQIICAGLLCRNATAEKGFTFKIEDVTRAWVGIACFAGKAFKLSGATGDNNAFIDTLVELANGFADRRS